MTRVAQGIATRTFVWALIGAVGVISAWQVGVGTPLQPGAGMFPLIVSLAIVVFAIADAGVTLRTHDLGSGEAAANASEGRKRFLVILVVLSYAALLPVIGSVLTMMIATFVLLFVVERQSLKLSGIVTVCTGLGLFLIFEMVLDVPLPIGWVWTNLGVV